MMMQRIFLFLLISLAALRASAQTAPTATGKWTGTITQVNFYTGQTYPYDFEMNLVQTGDKFTGMTHIHNGTDYAYIEISGTFDGTTLDIVTARLDRGKIGQNYVWCSIKGKLAYSETTGFAWFNGHSFGSAFSTGQPCDMDIIKVKKTIPIIKTDSTAKKPVLVDKPKKDTTVTVVSKPKIDPIKTDTTKNTSITVTKPVQQPLADTTVKEKIVIGKKSVEDIYGRKPKPGKTIEVNSTRIKIRVTDNATVDGDSISLYFNEEKLLDNVALTHSAKTVTLNLDPGSDVNAVIFFAENLGKTPPNTALVEIDDGTRKQMLNLESDLDRCDIIYLKLKK